MVDHQENELKHGIGVLGASARAACESLIKSGLPAEHCIGFDLYGDQDLQKLCNSVRLDSYVDFLRAYAELNPEQRPSHILLSGGLENYPDLLEQIACHASMIGSAPIAIRNARQADQVAKAIAGSPIQAPINISKTFGVSQDTPNDETEMLISGPERWLVKPFHSIGGQNISIVPTKPGLRELEDLHQQGYYVQQFIAGESISAVYATNEWGVCFVGSTQQLYGESALGTDGFTYCGSLGPWPMDGSMRKQLRDLGECLSQKLGLRGLFGVDLIWTGEQFYLLEINARYTASVEVLEQAILTSFNRARFDGSLSPFSLLELLYPRDSQTTLCNDRNKRAADPSVFFGKAILFAHRQLIISEQLCRYLMQHTDINGGSDPNKSATENTT